MTDKPTAPQLEIVSPSPTPNDALDIEALWLDPALGDGLVDASWHSIPVGKPRDFFRVHPDPSFRRQAQSTPTRSKARSTRRITFWVRRCAAGWRRRGMCFRYLHLSRRLAAALAGDIAAQAQKDNTAWSTARAAARVAIDKWVRLVWSKRSYLTRDALPGYAPDPDWGKLPAFNELVKAAFGPHGIIQDTTHPIYRELMGAPGDGQHR